MPSGQRSTSPPSSGQHRFEATQWSMVLAAGEDQPRGREALQRLCSTYWYPLYAFVRRQGHGPSDAQDLTQEFFARLLEKRWLAAVDRNKGRFRAFLLAAMKHFLANEWDHAKAKKRGGGRAAISLDAMTAEQRYAMEPQSLATPEQIFDRRWALTLLDQVLNLLRDEYAEGERLDLFEALKSTLVGDTKAYAEIGQRLGMNEGAVKVAAHRFRRRYRDLIRREVARTVDGEAQVQDELRSLMSALQL